MDPDQEVAIRELGDAGNIDAGALFDLPLGSVHVWTRSLAADGATIATSRLLLSEDERLRASRFLVERARIDFVLTRAALRILLARYLAKRPEELYFQFTKYGKPVLDNASDFSFNVSHTDGLALLAFARRNVGVDIERIRPEPDARKLAERFFSERERDALSPLRGEELKAAFFRCWSRKEAYIKARGEGLSMPLSQFDVSVGENASRVLLETRPDSAEANRWRVLDLAVHPKYAAAVAFAL